MNDKPYEPFKGSLTEEEWREIVTLDYVLTWHYTDDYAGDLKRYKELSAKRWGTN
jgi:hypothetical protein